jgi:Cof subfamily protein (haloacid dehalogenase superfamily)
VPVIRLVATDLDGTIVRHDGTVSARTVRALAAVEEAGLTLVLVTGRPTRWMHPVVEATGHRGVAVCANGALVYDLHTEEILESFPLPAVETLEAVRRLRAVMPAAAFAVERGRTFAHEPSYHSRWDPGDDEPQAPVEELLARPAVKLLVRDETSDGDTMLATALGVLGDLVQVTHSNANDCLLEISAPGVTKASTLALFAGQIGVRAEEVLAFGDQPNDVEMLQWAGSGHAMGNAHPDVLAAVPLHARSVEEDGVAEIVERLLAGGLPESRDPESGWPGSGSIAAWT